MEQSINEIRNSPSTSRSNSIDDDEPSDPEDNDEAAAGGGEGCPDVRPARPRLPPLRRAPFSSVFGLHQTSQLVIRRAHLKARGHGISLERHRK